MSTDKEKPDGKEDIWRKICTVFHCHSQEKHVSYAEMAEDGRGRDRRIRLEKRERGIGINESERSVRMMTKEEKESKR